MSLTRTAQEKVNFGLELSPIDIKTLLDDPQSFRRKLNDALQNEEAAKKRAIIEYYEVVFQEQRIEAQQEREEERKTDDRTEKQIEKNVAISQQQGVAAPELSVLQQMNPAQIAAHAAQQALTTGLGNLISTQMGPSVTLSSGTQLNVPATTTPAPSAGHILAVNKTLGATVAADPVMAKAFASFHTKMETGPLGVIKKYNEILTENKIEALATADRKELMRLIDSVLFNINKNNPELAQQIFQGNELSVRLFSQKNNQMHDMKIILPAPAASASLGKKPALFGIDPYQQAIAIVPGHSRKRKDLDEEQQQPRQRTRSR